MNEQVIDVLCEYYGITQDAFNSKSRKKNCARAKQMYCYICHVEHSSSISKLAREMGLTPRAIFYNVSIVRFDITKNIGASREYSDIKKMLGGIENNPA